MMGDITNNSAGLGYSGIDAKTKKNKWTLVENVNIWEIESTTSK